MTRPKTPWPRHAIWAGEDTTALLIEIDGLARQVQELIAAGDALRAVMLLGDIRNKTHDARDTLAQARGGERT